MDEDIKRILENEMKKLLQDGCKVLNNIFNRYRKTYLLTWDAINKNELNRNLIPYIKEKLNKDIILNKYEKKREVITYRYI